MVGCSVVKPQLQLDLSVECHFDCLARHHAILHAVYVKLSSVLYELKQCSVFSKCKGASVLFNLLSEVNVRKQIVTDTVV